MDKGYPSPWGQFLFLYDLKFLCLLFVKVYTVTKTGNTRTICTYFFLFYRSFHGDRSTSSPQKMAISTWSSISRHLYVRFFGIWHLKLSVFAVQNSVSVFWNFSWTSFYCIWKLGQKSREKLYFELFFTSLLN